MKRRSMSGKTITMKREKKENGGEKLFSGRREEDEEETFARKELTEEDEDGEKRVGEEGEEENGKYSNELSEHCGDEDGSATEIPEMISTLFGGNGNYQLKTRRKKASQREEERKQCLEGQQNGRVDPRDTRSFNTALVEVISKHPALFDFTRDEYKSTEARNRHWEAVASELRQSVEFVRTRWKTLRDRFKKEVRRQQQNAEGPVWQHYEEMLYLLPFIRDKLLEESTEGGTAASDSGGLLGGGSKHQRGENAGGGRVGNSNGGCKSLNGPGKGPFDQKPTAQQLHAQSINSCTAAILDLAMNAVTKLSPPPSAEDSLPSQDSSDSPKSTPVPTLPSRRFSSAEGVSGVESSSATALAPSGPSALPPSHPSSSCGGTAIVTTSLLRPFPTGPFTVQRSQGKGAKKEGTEVKWQDDDRDEDELFCKIVYRKLRNLGDERLKEFAKARIIDLLVEIKYGGTDGAAGSCS